ncbi:MAG: class I SAM-dependent methyltransferase [Verrucomicrobia subdivision 3 bacterium]|nr:class I SAM-dependent methyltransferase [Limisphaerales bacterium]
MAAAAQDDFEFKALDEARNYRRALLREFAPFLRGRVLEVGAGIGQFTEGLLDLLTLKELVCVEPCRHFCEIFRLRYPATTLVEGTAQEVSRETPWDAILSVNVLEHIENDELELATYRDFLRERGGRLCLFVPARREIYAPIDKQFGHFRRYARAELDEELRRNGFQVLRLRYFNIAGYFGWWFTFCFLKKRSFDPAAVRFFDRCIFPVVNYFETSFAFPPFGQSLLAVARALP